MSEAQNRPSLLRLVLSWTFVGVPLVWGITQTVLKAWALFKK